MQHAGPASPSSSSFHCKQTAAITYPLAGRTSDTGAPVHRALGTISSVQKPGSSRPTSGTELDACLFNDITQLPVITHTHRHTGTQARTTHAHAHTDKEEG